ncbi:MAG: hypothetical protein P4N60_11165 [Verrucomicrobiae bacterium]|nr:hypothetical protein [Verrucomicrobiae bacterium]
MNMQKEIRTELRDLKKQNRAALGDFNAAMKQIAKARKKLLQDEAVAARIFRKRGDRILRRQAILEGRLS